MKLLPDGAESTARSLSEEFFGTMASFSWPDSGGSFTLKVLLLVMAEQRVLLHHLYDEIKRHCTSCDVVRLSRDQQSHLARVLREFDFRTYDRVVVFTRLKRQLNQLPVLRCIPGLVFLEHDACQNYMDYSKYRGGYSKLYRQLPWARVLCSGFVVSRQLQGEGVDAVFVPKGYDESFMRNQGQARDVEAAFIGSTKSAVYKARKQLLDDIAGQTELQVMRTGSGEEYRVMLNRVRIFVSADAGMGEYMIKNFEAMACGCVLLAFDQGETENAALGFVHGRNVLLYRTAEQAVQLIRQLRSDCAFADRIAQAGQELAEQRFSFARIGAQLAQEIQRPMRPWPGLTFGRRLWALIRYGMKV